ncbi:capsid protein [Macochavirus kuci]|uniref:Capsid protein n=1 Tax=Porcine associated circular DNA virus-3 TaxID=2853798 RepID=A0A8F4NUR8_9VIRU|nr:capsid protein [Porcine associated circular DNA virus-3]
MVYRRSRKRYRRRYGRPRRKVRMSKSLYKRRRYRGNRRRGKKSSGLTVSGNRESCLEYSSFIPMASEVYGSYVGVLRDGFYTWSINPLPAGVVDTPGDAEYVGSWKTTGPDVFSRSIGRTTGEGRMLMDLPLCISQISVRNLVKCNTLFELCKSYRIVSVSCTFTVPERTSDGPNHNLYLMWTHLPKCRAADSESCFGMVAPEPTSLAGGNSPTVWGWNWIANPADIAEACSVDGIENGRNGWQRKQLAYNNPVTISWRPRHAKIIAAHENYTDSGQQGGVAKVFNKTLSNFASDFRLSRGYLPTDIDDSIRAERQYWMGPCIRLIDGDVKATEPIPENPVNNIFDMYGIRVTTTIKVRFKGMNTSDPIFPNYQA